MPVGAFSCDFSIFDYYYYVYTGSATAIFPIIIATTRSGYCGRVRTVTRRIIPTRSMVCVRASRCYPGPGMAAHAGSRCAARHMRLGSHARPSKTTKRRYTWCYTADVIIYYYLSDRYDDGASSSISAAAAVDSSPFSDPVNNDVYGSKRGGFAARNRKEKP